MSAFVRLECPVCEFDCIVTDEDARKGKYCVMCAEDSGNDVRMCAMDGPLPDRVEGRDARPPHEGGGK